MEKTSENRQRKREAVAEAGTETRAVAEMGTGTRITGTGTRVGSGRAEERRRSGRNRSRLVDAMWETGETMQGGSTRYPGLKYELYR